MAGGGLDGEVAGGAGYAINRATDTIIAAIAEGGVASVAISSTPTTTCEPA